MRIKICGITTVADAVEAARLGADAVGLNFYAKSKRHVSPAIAAEIVDALPPFVEPVGLFVNHSPAAVASWLAANDLDDLRTVQLHADTHQPPPASAYRWIPAFPVRDRQSLTAIDTYLAACRHKGSLPAGVVVDAHVPGEYGGTGQTAPWQLLADWRPAVPLILAGGLNPDNVADAIRLVRPYAVDVASGVESSPGRKDPKKMRRFLHRAREAFLSL